MKQVLVLGAGKSSPYLIDSLSRFAAAEDWFVTVGDLDIEMAAGRIGGHGRARAVHFDVNDSVLRDKYIGEADLVVNFLAPKFQTLVAWDCVQHGTHMISASYRTQKLRDLDVDARRQGVLILAEMGLDPGIDNMSAMALIDRLHGAGGRITSFCSYGSGIPAADQEHNPFRYVITWNPRNVVMSAEHGAQFMEEGRIKIVPYHHVFHHTWRVEVDGVGALEAYPNRDSLSYMQAFGLDHVHTMIRGTLRYPGWSETWARIVQLGLPNETLRIPNLADRTYAEVVEMFLPLNVSGPKMDTRVARFLGISPTGSVIEKMRWLGLFDNTPTGCRGDTSAHMLVELLERKLPLRDGHRDMVVLKHDLEVAFGDGPVERIESTLVARGEPGGFTAMAKTVGGPAALAARMILRGELDLTGCLIPTEPAIYEPVLAALAADGIAFTEKVAAI
ncbi:saccharopine dehydrogenase NADP-binding domain-containing protein [bacterium]|nr:saccharopine dehydrogenase NADP-binding domain-containing protein [bacterium]MBU1676931.1 saccharopine dehydrogenase NADP-binding domain-containing protein [bacterium]